VVRQPWRENQAKDAGIFQNMPHIQAITCGSATAEWRGMCNSALEDTTLTRIQEVISRDQAGRRSTGVAARNHLTTLEQLRQPLHGHVVMVIIAWMGLGVNVVVQAFNGSSALPGTAQRSPAVPWTSSPL
jgi:hypothetical protein